MTTEQKIIRAKVGLLELANYISWRIAWSWVQDWRNNQSVFRKAKTRPVGR
jgi:hypothetical protein